MTDPWSVQGTKEVIEQENSINKATENQNQSINSVPGNETRILGFEDSFIQDNNSNTIQEDSTKDIPKAVVDTEHQPLPDSESYLKSLERKLAKLKKNSKLVEALSEKRNDCLRSMLQETGSNGYNNEQLLELEANINNCDSAVQNLYRQIQPIQPVTIGETVHIVKYDQLEEQRLEAEAEITNGESEENLPASR